MGGACGLTGIESKGDVLSYPTAHFTLPSHLLSYCRNNPVSPNCPIDLTSSCCALLSLLHNASFR